MKTVRRSLIITFLIAIVCAFSIGFTWEELSANNEEEISATAFEMEYGASVRTVAPAGIRFTALVGKDVYNRVEADENKSFGMFIVPDSYMEEYEEFINTNTEYEGKYFEYFSEYKKMINFTYEIEQLVPQNGGYVMRGAITNVLFDNLTRKFIGVAYIKTVSSDGVEYEYADFSRKDNARSVSYVSSAAINAGKGNTALEQYLKNSAYRLLGVNYNADDGTYGFGVNEYSSLEEIAEIDLAQAYSLSEQPLTINVGESLSITNDNLASLKVEYVSSDESIVKVDANGLVTALKEGKATVTAKAGSYSSEREVVCLDKYYEFGADEMILALSTTSTYEKCETTVLGRENVYAYTAPSGWKDFLAAKHTSHRAVDSSQLIYSTTSEVNAGIKENGYTYVAIDFALSEEAKTTLFGIIPATGTNTSQNGYVSVTAGQPLVYAAAVDTDEEREYFAIYSNGKRLAIGDTVEANVWYTGVVKIMTSGWANVGFTVASNEGKSIYVSGVRYYTNDDCLEDYYEYGADEMVDVKATSGYAVEGKKFGRENVYKFTGTSNWTTEIAASKTTYVFNGAHNGSSDKVLANLQVAGIKYVAIDFAIDSSATLLQTIPKSDGSAATDTGGVTFNVGNSPAYRAVVDTTEEKSWYRVYSNGKEIAIGGNDKIQAGVWYTVVVKLYLGDAVYSNMYRSVGFGAAGSAYISSVRYYTNDSFKTDYVETLEEIVPQEPQQVKYTQYYFDSVLGNDENDGLTESTPKASIESAMEIASTATQFNPIELLFKKGSTFNGKAIFSGYQTTKDFPLILDAYGDGEGYPKFVGTGSETTKNAIDAVLYFKDDNVWVKNLEVTGPTAYQGIAFQPSSGGAFKNIVIEGNYVHDINFNWVYDTSPSETDPDSIDVETVCPSGDGEGRYSYRKYSAICLDNDYSASPTWFENVYITNNRVENVGKIGINVYNRWNNKGGVGYGYNLYVDGTEESNDPSKKLGNYPNKEIYVIGNNLACCGGDGLVVSGAKGGLIQRNVSYYANYLGREDVYNAGVWVFACSDIIFEYNESAYTYLRNGSHDAQGFDIDNACRNITFRYNYSHHNEGGGLLICNNTTELNLYKEDGTLVAEKESCMGDWGDNYVYGNLFVNNGNSENGSAFITLNREVSNAYIFNNTVIISGNVQNQKIIYGESAGYSEFYYYNNLFYSETDCGAWFGYSDTTSIFKGNLFFNVDVGAISDYNSDSVDYDPNFGEFSNKEYNGFDALNYFVPQNEEVLKGGIDLPEDLAEKLTEDALGEQVENKYIGALVG